MSGSIQYYFIVRQQPNVFTLMAENAVSGLRSQVSEDSQALWSAPAERSADGALDSTRNLKLET